MTGLCLHIGEQEQNLLATLMPFLDENPKKCFSLRRAAASCHDLELLEIYRGVRVLFIYFCIIWPGRENKNMQMHTHTYTHIHPHAHTHMHLHSHTDTHTQTLTHTHTLTHAHTHLHTHLHTYIDTPSHTHTHTHMHLPSHTHTHMKRDCLIHTCCVFTTCQWTPAFSPLRSQWPDGARFLILDGAWSSSGPDPRSSRPDPPRGPPKLRTHEVLARI